MSQTVLSQNIANADTPISVSDRAPQEFQRQLDAVRHIGIAQTNPDHITGTLSKPNNRIEEQRTRDTYEINPTGNAVILEEQIMRVTRPT